MIFIGAELSDPHAHFVTNVIESVGTKHNLVIDLLKVVTSHDVFAKITRHLQQHDEQYVIYNAYTNESFFIDFKKYFPDLKLIIVFSDDEWRHNNYDRYVALYADVFTVAVKSNLERYQQYGLSAFYMQWACNPTMFYPLENMVQDIDVSFIGVPYGQRINYVRALVKEGIQVRVYGRGWERFDDLKKYWGGFLSNEGMLQVIARSKINLNFLWTSSNQGLCTIKGRTLELAACRAFQLSNHTDEFSNYGFLDRKNMAVFQDKKHLIAQVHYYLTHTQERHEIAAQAYQHVLQNHTWQQRFQGIFKHIGQAKLKQKYYNIMAVVNTGVNHQLTCEDTRFNLHIVNASSDWQKKAQHMDGVVFLNHDSTLNNESLYMMAFGLTVDDSDVIAANFYIDTTLGQCWIQFKEKNLEQRKDLLHHLPLDCFMFSGQYAAQYSHPCSISLDKLNVSYIEYPSFSMQLAYAQSRKLRLYFGYYINIRQLLAVSLKHFRFDHAFSLLFDKLWQKMIYKI